MDEPVFKRVYPLEWPKGRARTREPQQSRFDTAMRDAVAQLRSEIRLLGGDNIRLTMNKLQARSQLDTGVSVYFMIGTEMVAMACDKWDERADNVLAIAKTIAAKRGEERWGATDVRESFAGHFVALPAGADDWRTTLELGPNATLADARAQYRRLAREAHPDLGGNPAQMTRLNAAITAAEQFLQ